MIKIDRLTGDIRQIRNRAHGYSHYPVVDRSYDMVLLLKADLLERMMYAGVLCFQRGLLTKQPGG